MVPGYETVFHDIAVELELVDPTCIRKESSLSQFFQEVDVVRYDMEEMSSLLVDLQYLDEEANSTDSAEILRGVRDRMDSNMISVLRKCRVVKGRLEALDESNRNISVEFAEGSPVYRTRVSTTNGMRIMLKEIMCGFQDVRDTLISDTVISEYKESVRISLDNLLDTTTEEKNVRLKRFTQILLGLMLVCFLQATNGNREGRSGPRNSNKSSGASKKKKHQQQKGTEEDYQSPGVHPSTLEEFRPNMLIPRNATFMFVMWRAKTATNSRFSSKTHTFAHRSKASLVEKMELWIHGLWFLTRNNTKTFRQLNYEKELEVYYLHMMAHIMCKESANAFDPLNLDRGFDFFHHEWFEHGQRMFWDQITYFLLMNHLHARLNQGIKEAIQEIKDKKGPEVKNFEDDNWSLTTVSKLIDKINDKIGVNVQLFLIPTSLNCELVYVVHQFGIALTRDLELMDHPQFFHIERFERMRVIQDPSEMKVLL